jgi:hypothetical protein
MMASRTSVGTMIVVFSMLTASAALAGPAMSVAWVEVSDQDSCVKQASTLLKRNGFTTRFEVISNRSIYGERGDYTAAVRCVGDHTIAFVAVSGPKSDLTTKYVDAIKDAF